MTLNDLKRLLEDHGDQHGAFLEDYSVHRVYVFTCTFPALGFMSEVDYHRPAGVGIVVKGPDDLQECVQGMLKAEVIRAVERHEKQRPRPSIRTAIRYRLNTLLRRG